MTLELSVSAFLVVWDIEFQSFDILVSKVLFYWSIYSKYFILKSYHIFIWGFLGQADFRLSRLILRTHFLIEVDSRQEDKLDSKMFLIKFADIFSPCSTFFFFFFAAVFSVCTFRAFLVFFFSQIDFSFVWTNSGSFWWMNSECHHCFYIRTQVITVNRHKPRSQNVQTR